MHPDHQLVRVGDVLVEPHAELVPAVENVRRLRVAVAGLVRQRHVVVEQLRRDRVEARGWDHVAGKRLAALRIADRRPAREVAGALRRVRHHPRVGGAAPVAEAFVVAEHECLVLDDRPAGRAAELVLIEGRLGHGKAVARLERIVAIEPPARALPPPGTRARDDADDRAGVAAVFRVEGVREDAELVDRVRRRPQHEAGVERVVVGRAIEQEIVRLVAHAVDVEAAGGVAEAARGRVARLSAQRRRRRDDAWHQRAELGEVAAVERQLDEVTPWNQQAEGRVRELGQRRFGVVDEVVIVDLADLEGERTQVPRLAGRQYHAIDRRWLE